MLRVGISVAEVAEGAGVAEGARGAEIAGIAEIEMAEGRYRKTGTPSRKQSSTGESEPTGTDLDWGLVWILKPETS